MGDSWCTSVKSRVRQDSTINSRKQSRVSSRLNVNRTRGTFNSQKGYHAGSRNAVVGRSIQDRRNVIVGGSSRKPQNFYSSRRFR